MLKYKLVDAGECKCVGKHVPLPMAYYRLESIDVTICPNSYHNLLRLLRWTEHYGKIPPGYIRKHYSRFIQDLARTIWETNVL